MRSSLGWELVLGQLLLAAGVSAGDVQLAWDPNPEPDLAGYRVHYGTQSAAYSQFLDVGDTTTATLSELMPGGTYFAAVTAYNTSGLESDYSNEISFTVALDNPISFRAGLDSDHDGLPDYFEIKFAKDSNLAPLSDLDADGIPALSEFVHGLDPTVPGFESVMTIEVVDQDGIRYLGIRYRLDPSTLHFVDLTVERLSGSAEGDLWLPANTTVVSILPSAFHPDLYEIVERSPEPLTAQHFEFLRLRYTVPPP